VITAAYNGDSDCAASNNTTTVDVTSSPTPPAPPGLIGTVLGGINIGNNYTSNEINSNKQIKRDQIGQQLDRPLVMLGR
jgi:hypothetical protein